MVLKPLMTGGFGIRAIHNQDGTRLKKKEKKKKKKKKLGMSQ